MSEAPTRSSVYAPARTDAGTPSVTTNAGDAALASANAAVALGFEQPYPVDARPRAASALQAAADDEELARWNIGGTADPSYISSQASFHPGTRVVVDAHLPGQHASSSRKPNANARGLTIDRVQAQARSKGYWPFRLCFEAGQREKKGLGGETRVRFTVTARGDVSSARLISSELRNAASTACLVGEVRRLRFLPRPTRHFDVVTSIRIWPGDVELPPLSETSAPANPIDTGSPFDPALVRARLEAKQVELTACFSEARRADPTLWGRLALAVILEVDGTVHRVNEVETHFPNAGAAHCAAAAVSTILFPSVNGKPFSFVVAMRLAPSAVTATPSGVAAPNEPKNVPESAPAPESADAGPDD